MALSSTISVLSSLILLLAPPVAAQGKLTLYTDFYCNHPSALNPTVSLAVATCLVPVGAMSAAIDLLPSCPSGNATMIVYTDVACARFNHDSPAGSVYSVEDNCWTMELLDDLKSVMLTCDDPALNPQPTSTTTVIVSQVAGVATNPPAASTTSPVHATTSPVVNPTAAVSPSSTTAGNNPTTNGNNGESTISTSGTSGNQSSGSTSNNNSSSGLSQSDKIAIGVGVGVGVPAVVVALLAWLCPCGRIRVRSKF